MWGVLWVLVAYAKEPEVVYLTWVNDPCTTMTIQWQTAKGEGPYEVAILQGKEWRRVEGETSQVSGVQVDVHIAHVEGLEEGRDYRFKLDEAEYRFRTLPRKLTRAVQMVVGGDIFYPGKTELFQKMNKVIASQDPDFVVLGGDLAYTVGKKNWFQGKKWEMGRWQTFLQELQKSVKGKDGRLVPVIPVVGNHDVKKRTPDLFYELFAFPERGKAYRMLDVGNYLSLALLDTGHTSPIEGEQAAWLEENLRKRQGVRYRWAAYHQAAYPSYYPYDGEGPVKIRKAWVPLFEKYGVSLAFEHHNHRFKRTYPLRGVTYLGDGSWGVEPRLAKEKHDYLEKSASVNACYFVTLTAKGCKVEARNLEGEVIDEVIFP